MKIQATISALTIVASGLFLYSCKSDPNSPGFEYMPDMYRSPSIEAYSANSFYMDSMSTRKPVENTIPRGFDPYPYPNTNEGYEAAGLNLKNPFPASPEIIAEGKVSFEKFCVHCHGKKGMGDGTVPTNSDYPPPPAYSGPQLQNLPEGKMFHSIHYGKNLMGSHASQITKEDRWKLIRYVQTLQHPDGMPSTTQVADTTIIVANSGDQNNK